MSLKKDEETASVWRTRAHADWSLFVVERNTGRGACREAGNEKAETLRPMKALRIKREVGGTR